MRLAYLFSRYPIVSQTFCDTEILALERMGAQLEIFSIYPPPTSFRHGHAARMRAPIHYAPPATILKLGEQAAKRTGRWPEAFIADHERKYGREYKAPLRARNALYFADLFTRTGITHFHVHFANRAAQTALFIKHLSGIPFSISTHGQDFMTDLGNDDLLREICREAEFVANETEFSRALVASRCPESAGKMLRVFNGMDLDNFPDVARAPGNPLPLILSTGRLIEFKGFHHLIAACANLNQQGLKFECEIIGEGPWREQLEAQIVEAKATDCVRLLGALPQEEVFRKLRSCDIFTLPCVVDRNGASDVFPTVILEAMASGKPVVSTRLAGVPEQINHEQTGLLVAPAAEGELAEALTRLVQSPKLREEFGQAARRRIETEFAVDQTVLPLKAMFDRFVKPSAVPDIEAAGYACLLNDWPGTPRQEAELRQMRAANPRLRVYAAHALPSAPNTESAPEIIASLTFLPDAMVLEAEWQQEREAARQIETWRVDFGQKLATEFFLQQARYALYLRRWIERDGVRHVHAMSTRELLCGWMLRRLCEVTLSTAIEEKNPFLPEAVIAKLLPSCVGVRVIGDLSKVSSATSNATAAPLFVPHKQGRGLEPAWLAQLAQWGPLSAKLS